MCRSGNHAIIFWLIDNLGGYKQEIDGCCYWNNESMVYFYNNCNHINLSLLPNYNYQIRSYEDTNKEYNNKIIILRDFINMFASRFKKYGEKLGFDNTYLQDYQQIKKLWIELAKEIIEGKAIGILYNRWLVEKHYRDFISKQLDIPNINDNIDHVSKIGEGSSFIGDKVEEDKNNYLTRYKQVEIPEVILNDIKNDEDLIELNKKLFKIDLSIII